VALGANPTSYGSDLGTAAICLVPKLTVTLLSENFITVPRPSHLRQENSMAAKTHMEHHESAAEHHESAAEHHREAAKHYKAGDHEKAAHHAHLAHGHGVHASHHAEEAAKHHVEHHDDHGDE
jgi:hypothetical protein